MIVNEVLKKKNSILITIELELKSELVLSLDISEWRKSSTFPKLFFGRFLFKLDVSLNFFFIFLTLLMF